MRAVYNAIYASIFLYFLRIVLNKCMASSDGSFCLYLPDCKCIDGTVFTVRIAKLRNRKIIEKMSEYLTRNSWRTDIAPDGMYFPPRPRPIYDIDDKYVKSQFSPDRYKEIYGALQYMDARSVDKDKK